VTEEPDFAAVARGVIDANRFMTLATADRDGVPWASPVWYAPEDHARFLWVSDPEARHSRNIAERPQVGIVIFDSHATGGWKSVYMSALAEEMSGAGLERGIESFSARSVEQGFGAWTEADVRPPARRRLYRATASEHYVLTPQDRRVRLSFE
jgi:nitroimidazol reductase NimA-like FMN-containing flavoprotein (pyridoxamine 5'-phosphate oxidase superfamily)